MDIRSVKFDSDFPRIVDLINQVEPEPVTLAQLQQWTQRKPPGRVYRQMVATDAQERVIKQMLGYRPIPGKYLIRVNAKANMD